jgi:hypothetical protein
MRNAESGNDHAARMPFPRIAALAPATNKLPIYPTYCVWLVSRFRTDALARPQLKSDMK